MLRAEELIVDNFAGGGGASTGIFMATGRHPDIAINHDPEAIAMHKINHPGAKHYCEDVFSIDPAAVCAGRPVGLAWFSPDCKHFSKAKGGKPVNKKIRGLAWVVVKWARTVKPRIIILENVEEFETWGPLTPEGKPCPERKGLTFRLWWKQLERLGYQIDKKEIRACDYGAPTIRKRLFIVARCDGLPIVWPEPTHGDPKTEAVKSGRLRPWRTAAECIDWSIPCPSIFERSKPLAENTLKRIARGIQRYVIDAQEPFIVTYYGPKGEDFRGQSLQDPLATQTTENRHGLVTPCLVRIGQTGGNGKYSNNVNEPLTTITSKAEHCLISPVLIGAGGPTYSGKPVAPDQPFGTLTTENHRAIVAPVLARHFGKSSARDINQPHATEASHSKTSLVAAFLAQHNGGFYDGAGRAADEPLSTITHRGTQQQVVTSHLVKLKGTCKDGQPVTEPMPTVQAGGLHIGEVRAFLIKYYSTGSNSSSLQEPAPTVTAMDRLGLVTIHGQDYQIVDIGMRMLQPRELYLAQGFPSFYIIEFDYNGKPLPKSSQVKMCGNSVSPYPAEAIVMAQLSVTAANKDYCGERPAYQRRLL